MNYELLHPGSKTRNPPNPSNRFRMERICANCGQRFGAHYGSSMCPISTDSGLLISPHIDYKLVHDMTFKEGGTINYEEIPKVKPSFLDDNLFEID